MLKKCKTLTLPLSFVNSNFGRGWWVGWTMIVPLILDQAAKRQTEQNIMLSSSNFEYVLLTIVVCLNV